MINVNQNRSKNRFNSIAYQAKVYKISDNKKLEINFFFYFITWKEIRRNGDTFQFILYAKYL